LSRFHPLRVADVRRETPECVSVAFEVPEELRETFRFVQGQHLVLRVVRDGEELRRTYSICSAVDEGELRIAVKRQPHGRVSTWINEHLKVGDVLEVMPPQGRFFVPLDPAAERFYVAFAAGSGITPIMSILKTTLRTESKSHFLLFYGNRNTRSIIFREELEYLKNVYMDRFGLYHVLSAEVTEGLETFSGRITPDKVRAWAGRLFDPGEVDAFFICGPAPMIQDLADTLEELGVPRERVYDEYFTTVGTRPRIAPHAPLPVEVASEAAQVTVILDGERHEIRVPFNGQSLLEAARAAGLDVPFSCTSGVCATCRARVLEGRVDMAVNYALEDWEVERGEVLTCQARPLTERVVVDYDAR